MDWKSLFRKDIEVKLRESKREYDIFKRTGEVIYLQQAGNKLFSLVENYLMVKYDKKVEKYGDVRKLVFNNKFDKELLIEANLLHKFYYNSTLYMDIIDAEFYFLKVYNKIKGRIQIK